MSEKIPTPLSLLAKIGQTDSYLSTISELAGDNPDVDTRRLVRSRAIGAGALALVDEHAADGKSVDTEVRLLKLISTVMPFNDAALKIERARQNGTYTREQYADERAATIDFNTAVRDIIDHDPRMTPEQLQSFLESTFVTSYGTKDLEFFTQHSSRVIVGMQHEIGFEQIINHIDGLTYRAATKEEELSDGVDMYITFYGKEIPIDIKAGQRKALEANEQNTGFRQIANYKMWSHVTNDEFKNSFRIPYELAVAKAERVKQALEYASTLEYARAA